MKRVSVPGNAPLLEGTTVTKLVRRGLRYLWLLMSLTLPRRVFGRASLATPSRKRT